MKEIKMLYYPTNPSEANTGLKSVLWAITHTDGSVAHDWGYGYWDGKEWEGIEVPEGYTAAVVYWANTVDPQLLLKEKSKIIKLGE